MKRRRGSWASWQPFRDGETPVGGRRTTIREDVKRDAEARLATPSRGLDILRAMTPTVKKRAASGWRLFKNWLHDESNWRRLLKKILAGNSNRLDRLVDGRWASGHDPRDGAIGITHCIADRARSLLWN